MPCGVFGPACSNFIPV